nr:hypothetical protein [Rubellimicrobium mesophilum]
MFDWIFSSQFAAVIRPASWIFLMVSKAATQPGPFTVTLCASFEK